MSSSSINNNHPVSKPHFLRSGAGSTPNPQNSAVALPQSNGVNITIINPTTNVSGTTSNEKITPNPADSFTPSPQTASTPPALQPLAQPPLATLPPATTNMGGSGFQQQPVYF